MEFAAVIMGVNIKKHTLIKAYVLIFYFPKSTLTFLRASSSVLNNSAAEKLNIPAIILDGKT